MSFISGEMVPQTPGWLQGYYANLQALGFPIDTSEESGAQFSTEVDEVGLEFLKVQLQNPDKALEAIPEFLHRFRNINLKINFPADVLPEEFGLIFNIASRQYGSYDADRMHFLLYLANDFLRDKNPKSVGQFTAELRSAEFLRDLVAHEEATNWPDTGKNTSILRHNFDWEVVMRNMSLNESNAIMYALHIPEASTDAYIRARFRVDYPDLSQQGIDIIAARLYNRGAYSEMLRDDAPNDYDNWETTIYQALGMYGPEYRPYILAAIAAEKWHVFDDTNLASRNMLDKMLHTSFALTYNGWLVRQPH